MQNRQVRRRFIPKISIYYISVLLFLVAEPCFSQILISGILADSAGTGIEYANIQVISDRSYSLISDSSGIFSQVISKPGPVQIKISRINFIPWISSFRVTCDTSVVITLKARPVTINEVNVVAPKGSDINAIIIKKSDFALKSGSLGETDVFGLLQQNTGIIHSSEVSPGLYVRGMEYSSTGMFFSGAELFGINHMLSIYPQFNSDAISNVSLQKAEFDPRYGGFLSSYLLVEPDNQLYSDFGGGAEFGVLNSKFCFNIPIVKDKLSTKLAFRSSYFDLIANSYNNLNNDPDNLHNLPLYGFLDINGSFAWHLKDKSSFTLDLLSSSDNMKFNESGLHLNSFWQNNLISGNWKVISSPLLEFETFAGYTWFNLNTVFTNISTSEIQNRISQGNVVSKLNFRFHGSVKNEIGFDLKLTRLDLNAGFVNSGIGESWPVTCEVPSSNLAFFDNFQVSAARNLKFKIGIRAELFHSDASYLNFLPYLSVDYNIRGYAISLSYSKQIQYKHLYIPTGIYVPLNIWYPSQTDIPPERARHYNFSVSKNISGNLDLSLSYYYLSLNDLTEFRDGNYFTTNTFKTDQGSGYSRGVEISFLWKTSHLEIEGGLTLSESRRKFQAINDGEWFSPSYDIPRKIDFCVLYKAGSKWTFALSEFLQDGFVMTLPTSIYMHQQESIAGDLNYSLVPVYTTRYNFRMPLSHRMDISASYHFKLEGMEGGVDFGVYNIYNYRNPYLIYFVPETRADLHTYMKAQKKALLPVVPFASLKISF